MKKIFAFAIAAATMAVGCQKLQDLVNPNNTPVDENDLVEIQFSSNIATVEAKSPVTDLAGLKVNVYGINNDTDDLAGLVNDKYAFQNIVATATQGEDGISLSLAGAPYYYNGKSDKYSFYGYYLDEAEGTIGNDGNGQITITGAEDVLLATAEGNGTFCGNLAKNGTHPHLKFDHALSQFQFAAVNRGSTAIKLTDIEIKTPVTGTVNVFAKTVTAGNESGMITALANAEVELVSKLKNPTDWTSIEDALVMVMPGATYEFVISVSQGDGQTNEYTLSYDKNVEAGKAYKFQIILYSLEQIEITAELAEWGEPLEEELDTDPDPVTEPEETPEDGE